MDESQQTGAGRAVLVQTTGASIEGLIDVAQNMRTSDHLNHACSRFVSLTVERGPEGLSSFREGALSVSTASVLFVVERGLRRSISDARVEASRFTRSGVRLALGEFEIEGFIHVPGLTNVTSWLIKNRHPFVPLTAASVSGPGVCFAASFLAFNPAHVQLIQHFDPQHELAELEPALDCANG